MKITLWFLNRITQWERDHPGELARALSPHDVRLGRRVVSLLADDESRDFVQVAVNQSEVCFRGELMHEGYQQALHDQRTAFDEYFVPIPLKCLGCPDFSGGRPQLTAFWKDLIPAEKRSEFLRLFDHTLNPCFSEELAREYWDLETVVRHNKKGIYPNRDSSLANEFGDVRMNTSKPDRIGYYEILRRAAQQHGKNVLVGYSQGGAVANYLAFIDEHFVRPEKRCVLGVISVQGPLRGSTFAMHELESHVLNTLREAVLAIPLLTFWMRFVPADIRQFTDPLLKADHPLKIDEVADLLDFLWERTKDDADMREFIKTARKWLSGLSDNEQVAFFDIDPVRLDKAGSVLHALQTYPLKQNFFGAVSGTNYHLDPLLRSISAYKSKLLGVTVSLLCLFLHPALRRSEEVVRKETFDMLPQPVANPPLTALYKDWVSGAVRRTWNIVAGRSVPAWAHDFVIPSVSHLIPHQAKNETFVGNCVNPNASHISGALLNNFGRKDIYYATKLLKRIAKATAS